MFDIIKRQNGERFAKSIRAYDSGIFDIPNIDKIVKYAGRNAEPIMRFLIALKNIPPAIHGDTTDPFELLHRAGYHAEYADTLEKQNAIKKYFAPGEELCTFHDDTRYREYYIINAVRYDVDKIRRADFKRPAREDAYGTSVISIQIAKGHRFITIKNRYNHAVLNPDNTFHSNPDNIIPGLSRALEKRFNIQFSSFAPALPDGYVCIDDRIYKYNYEIDNTYIGDTFTIKNGLLRPIDKLRQIIIDDVCVDLEQKRAFSLINNTKNPFADLLTENIHGHKLRVVTTRLPNGETRRQLYADNVEIADVVDGKMMALCLPDTVIVPDFCMIYSKYVKQISLPNTTYIGDNFGHSAINVEDIYVPNVEIICDYFFSNGDNVTHFCANKLKQAGVLFFGYNKKMKSFIAQMAEKFGRNAFGQNIDMEYMYLPNAREFDEGFCHCNNKMRTVYLPNAVYVGDMFFFNSTAVEFIHMPKMRHIGNGSFNSAYRVRYVYWPAIQTIGNGVMPYGIHLRGIYAPNTKHIGKHSFQNARRATNVRFDKLNPECYKNLPNNMVVQCRALRTQIARQQQHRHHATFWRCGR